MNVDNFTMSHKFQLEWLELKKIIALGQIDDNSCLQIANMYSKLFDKKFILPCKCDASLWRTWIKYLNRLYEKETEFAL